LFAQSLFAYRLPLALALVTLAYVTMNNTSQTRAADEPIVIALWEGTAPGSEEFKSKEVSDERGTPEQSDLWIGRVSQPTLTVVAPFEYERNGTGVVICPGGGYSGLAFEKEGLEMGRWFAKQGVTAFVLKYRHGGGVHQHPVPLNDVRRAMRIVRSQAEQWKLADEKIGVMGFSAGGHLASSLGTHFDAGSPNAEDEIERERCRPDFMVLVYPVISMDAKITHLGSLDNLLGEHPDPQTVELMSNDKQVTDNTPPTFITHASDDQAVPVENALRFYRALIDHKVPAELHVFAEGGHGFGMRNKDKPVVEWPNLLANWLRSRQLID
jgi:acetyl esterase/lipase